MPSEITHSDSGKLVSSVTTLTGILILVAISLWRTYPSKPEPISAPPSEFSATRALEDVKQTALHPHPTGAKENAQVRHYLTASISALGYVPKIQPALAINPDKQSLARIHNILVRAPGSTPGKALLLAAHYDSVPTGPGAADDGASVAAMLEILRALKHNPKLTNDVIFLFTDGEEMGLFGADAFVSQHPWAKGIGLALNFEYRGNRGALMMFETSAGNGKLVEGLANADTGIWANSLMYEVYKRLPNDTDFTVFKNSGLSGMNFAAIEGHTAYHTALDRPELLDLATLQQEGETMLALVRQFGNTSLENLASEDRIYFDLPGFGLIHYPSSWAMPLTGVAALLFVTVVTLSFRRKQVRAVKLFISPFLFISVVLSLAYGCHLIWQAVKRVHPEYDSFFQGDTYNSHWYLLAFVLLTISLSGFLQKLMGRWLNTLESIIGAAFCWLVLAITCGFLLPGASYLFIWPPVAMLIAVFADLTLTEKHGANPFTIYWYFIGAISGILFFAPLIKGLFTGLTPQMIGVAIACLCLLLGLLVPVFHGLFRRKIACNSLLLLSLISFAVGSATSGFDSLHPRQDTLFYALNSNKNRAYWLSTDKRLDQWTKTFFHNQSEKRRVPEIFGDATLNQWTADAPALPLLPPQIEKLADNVSEGNRVLKLKVKSIRHAPKLSIEIEGAAVLSSKVAGKAYSQTPRVHWRLDSFGLNDEDLVIDLTVKPGVPFTVRATDFSYGLPELTFTPRPSDTIPKPGEYSDTTVVVKTIGF